MANYKFLKIYILFHLNLRNIIFLNIYKFDNYYYYNLKKLK